MNVCRHSTCSVARVKLGRRRRSVPIAICPSSRANGAPKQKCMPQPKARWRLAQEPRDVVVAREHPHPGRVLVHGILGPQTVIEGVRVLDDLGEQWVELDGFGRGHQRSPIRNIAPALPSFIMTTSLLHRGREDAGEAP